MREEDPTSSQPGRTGASPTPRSSTRRASPGSGAPLLDLPEGDLQLAPLDGVAEADAPGPSPPLAQATASGAPTGAPPSSAPPPSLENAPALELAYPPAAPTPSAPRQEPAPGPPNASGAPPPQPPRGPSAAMASLPEGRRPAAPGPPDQDKASSDRRRLLILLGGLGASIALAGVWYGFGLGKDEAETPRPRPDTDPLEEGDGEDDDDDDAPLSGAPTREIRLTFQVTPRTARLLVKGHAAPGHLLLAPYSETPLTLRFEAEGYQPLEVSVTPNRDQRIPVRLQPAAEVPYRNAPRR